MKKLIDLLFSEYEIGTLSALARLIVVASFLQGLVILCLVLKVFYL